MADLSEKIKVSIPLRGGDKIDLDCSKAMIDYALSTELAEFLRDFWRRRTTAEIFLNYNNLHQMPPRIF
ncbi:MAG: hypothetical protein AAB632_02930, partial [Patescibacteria group bacterium]